MEARPGLIWVGVVVLLAAWWFQATTAAAGQSPTFDEILHLQAGVGYWEHGDFRSSPLQSTLPCRWAALPAALSADVAYPAISDPAWRDNLYNALGTKFLYGMGNDAAAVLGNARSMAALWGVGLGLLVFGWARHLFGAGAGLLALGLFAFSPTMLAHGPLITAGVPAAFFLLAATSSIWLVLQRITVWRLVLSCLAVAGLLLTKMSGLLILPIAVGLVGIRVWQGARRPQQFVAFAGAALLHVLVAAGLIWSAFGFRYSAFGSPGAFLEPWSTVMARLGGARPAIGFLREHELLPEGWLYGLASILGSSRQRPAFLAGEYSTEGWVEFFPICLAIKTPLALFALLLLAACAWISRGTWRATLTRGAPLFVLFAGYWVAALTSSMNIGHRHLLPTYPVLFILAGAALTLRPVWGRVLVFASAAAFLAGSLSIRPHYLAYFNLTIGGPAHGYRWLVDSSLDWGQDLPSLRRWIDANTRAGESVYLSYFGSAPPEHYGIQPLWLPGYVDRTDRRPPWQAMRPGTYCISATLLQRLYTPYMGPWDAAKERLYQQMRAATRDYIGAPPARRAAAAKAQGAKTIFERARRFQQLSFLRLCTYLLRTEPADRIGYSIHVYRVTRDDLRRALEEPL